MQASPLQNSLFQSKICISADQQPDPVQVLQQKLETLEHKYMNFVERCSDLLKSENLSKEAKDLISSCSSSYCFSPTPQIHPTKDSKNLLDLLTQLENGSLIKNLMAKVSNIVQTSQNFIFRSSFFSEKSKKTIQESHKSLTAEIWQGLFNYEHYVQSAVKSCMKKIIDYEKVVEENQKFKEIDSDNQRVREKYLMCKVEKCKLEKKLNEFGGGKLGDTQQSSKSTRSLLNSPAPVGRLTMNSGCRVMDGAGSCIKRVKNGLEAVSALRSGDSYEVEKREIQDQLRNLQVKLMGFEKVAKSLIDSSIRAELNSIGKKQIDHNKSKANLTPDISMFGSHLSILDIDQLQKNMEILEKEKSDLESTLTIEKKLNHDLKLENWENSKKITENEKDLEKISAELSQCLEELLQEKEHKLQQEKKTKELERKQKELERKLRESEYKQRETEYKLKESDLRLKETEHKLRGVEKSAKEAELKLKNSEFDLKELERTAKESELKLREAECRLRELERDSGGSIVEYKERLEQVEEEKERLGRSVAGLNENRKALSEKIKEKDLQIENLMAEVNSTKVSYSAVFEKNKGLKAKVKKIKEEKLKIMSFSAKHAENAKKCEEDLKFLDDLVKKSKENERKHMETAETSQRQLKETQIILKNLENEVKTTKGEKEKLENMLESLKGSKDAAGFEHGRLSGLIKELKSELDSKKTEINALKASSQALEKQLSDVQARESETRLELAETKLKNHEKTKENLELLKKVQDLSTSFNLNAEEKTKSLEECIKVLQDTISKQQEAIEVLEQDKSLSLKSLSAAKSDLDQRNLLLIQKESQYSDLQTAYKDLQQQISALQAEINSLKSSLSHSQGVESQLKSQLLTQNTEQLLISTLKQDLKALELQILSRDLQLKEKSQEVIEAQRSVSVLSSAKESLDLEIVRCQSQVKDLQKVLQETQLSTSENLQNLNSQLKNSKNAEKILKTELEEAKNTIAGQEKQLAGWEEKLENLASENEELLMTLSNRSESLIKFKTCIKKIKQDLKSMKCGNLRAEISDIKVFILKKTEEFKNFAMNPHHAKSLESLVQEFKSNLQGLNVQNSGLYITIQKLNTKYENLLKDYNQKTQDFSSLHSQNSSLEVHLRASEDQLQQALKTLNSVTQEKSKLEQDLENTSKFLSNLKETLTKTQETNKELSETVKKLTEDLEKLKAKNSFLSEDLETFDLKINEKIKQVILLTEEKEALQQRISDSEQMKASVESEKNKQICFLTEKLEGLQRQLADLEDLKEKIKINNIELFQIDQENQQLHKKLENKLKEVEKLNENLEGCRVELDKVQKEFKNVANENKRLIDIQSNQSESIKAVKDELESKEGVIRELEIVLKERNKEIEELNIKITKTQSEGNEDQLGGKGARIVSKPSLPLFFESSEKNLVPRPVKSKTGSLHSNLDPGSIKRSVCTEELNLTPCRLMKVVKFGNRKWALVQNEEGSFIWKEENTIHGTNLSEQNYEEDPEEIKICLAEWYKGSIIEAIEDLKKSANSHFSFQADDKFDLLSQSFKGEIFEAGLDISKIDIHVQENENFEQLSQELNLKISEIKVKDKKIEKKKRTLLLHKEQIVVLKEQIRKYQEKVKEMESAVGVDLTYLKQIFTNLIVKVKVNKKIEDLVIVVFKVLGFSVAEIGKVQAARRGGGGEVILGKD